MSGARSHNRNQRRLALLAAREAYWRNEAGNYPPGSTGKPPIWTRLWLQRRGFRPMPKAFRLPKNGSKMRFVGAGYHPTFPLHEPPEQHVSRLYRPGNRIEYIIVDDPDEAVRDLLSAKEELISRGIAEAFRVPEHLLGKN